MTRTSLVAAGLLLVMASGHLALAQEPNNELLRAARPHERVLAPVLEVRQLSGEFERWGREVTLTAPNPEVFRWSTPATGTASATWTVTEGPPGSDAAVVGSGSAGNAPRAGSVTVFRIDFRTFMASGPPAGGKTYWVVLEPVDESGQPGMKSMPVQVTYASQLGPANIAAFAGREDDIVAPTQMMALSKTSKLSFLQHFARELALLPAEAADIADAQVRLTPKEAASFAVSPDAIPEDHPHLLEFIGASNVVPWSATLADGKAIFRAGGAHRVTLSFAVEPGQIYLLEVGVYATAESEMRLYSNTSWAGFDCLLDFTSQGKDFLVSEGWNSLLATVKRPNWISADVPCSFGLFTYDLFGGDSTKYYFVFYSAELTKLTEE